MAGERTPDTSPGASSSGGSTDNDISLREHMQRQIEQEHRYFERLLAEFRIQLDERFRTQTEVLQARCDVESQRQAAALAASDSHIQMQLMNAATALNKAETATDKRFESVNEFRAQLADQTHSFMPRTESIQRHDANGVRIEELEKRTTEQIASLTSRLDRTQGNSAGIDKAWGYLLGAIGLLGAVVGIILAFN